MDQGCQISPPVQQPKLLDQVIADIRTKIYSMQPEEAYVHWIERSILFHKKLICLRKKYTKFHIAKLIRATGRKWNPNTKL